MLSFSLGAVAQQDSIPISTIIEKTLKFGATYPMEKVYLHTDKPYYAVGDTIWYKAYLTIEKHQLSGLSGIVYVDLINAQDSVVESQRLPVKNGSANGNITLTGDNYKQGSYRLRAYTNWMRNFDPDYFYDHTINIGNALDNRVNTFITYKSTSKKNTVKVDANILYKDPANTPYTDKKVTWQVVRNGDAISKGKGTTDSKGNLSIDIPESDAATLTSGSLVTSMDMGDKQMIVKTFSLRSAVTNYDVQFFPEGGQLTNGILTRVAFKAIDSKGLGADAQGNIIDDKGTEVAKLTTAHLGMGVFNLVPETGKSYIANINFADGSKASYRLPRVQAMGINLVVNNNQDSIVVKINANDLFLQRKKNKSFYLVAQSGGVIYYAASTVLQNMVYSANIPTSKFPTGLLQVTLFSSGGYALCERLVFIQHNDQLNLSLKTDKPSYTARQNVKLSFLAKNSAAVPVAGSFSVAVLDDATVPTDENNEWTILSNLLLTSELKGYIEKPNYYFNKPDKEKLFNLDVLMLTQGYHRFSYDDILADKVPQIFVAPEQGIDVSGILRTNSGLPVGKGSVRLLIPDKNFSAETITDMSGNFKFSNVMVQDTSKITLSARNNPNGKYMVINVNGEIFQKLSKNNNIADEVVNIDSTIRPYLENSRKQAATSKVLKEVVIKAKTIVKKKSHNDYGGTFSGLSVQADHEISSAMLKDCPDLLNCLSTLAMGLTYVDNNFYVTRDYNAGNKKPVQVYVDAMQVDVSFLASMSGSEVESVEIFLKDGLSNINRLNQTNGVMIINKKVIKKEKISFAQLQALIPKQNVVTFAIQGYTKAKEFYIPKYDVNKSSTVGLDLRNTLYWNPKIITDKTGAATFNFFNSDARGSYRAIVEGIDSEGNLGRYIMHFVVK
ncbi:hypothetical protein SAMN05216464_10321 [Mucilaginibacter pineti]|uniref:Carboxypeptidase regulatory-like domain-containing protein n=1 Tax=Mucilaginibacter pineti TaxID=1391627 RepID=A0A1G6YLG3_9SPHI|nr:hypothetical protein SAMN05216464_10321 [Mucilaginibacter pineti]